MRIRRHLVAAAAAAALTSCNPTIDNNRSQVELVVTGFNDRDGEELSGFFSDVVADDGFTTADDILEVVLRSRRKNSTGSVSDFYTVHLRGYEVFFTRVGGRNEPGVDVPFSRTFALGGSVTPGGTLESEFLAVPAEAKLEAPLRELWFESRQRLDAALNIRVFGVDEVENEVTAQGSLLIVFGDF